jgi:phenol 2-monooxygenase
MKHMAHSKSDGTVLMVPREEGMVRVYTQLGSLAPGERVNRDEVTLDRLLAKTQTVLAPYKIEFPYVDWWTCYEIGQRVCDTFAAHGDHVFIAGDACHTHSPKAGQGMNVSMMDTFNLGWKLASVINGLAKSEILHTCEWR